MLGTGVYSAEYLVASKTVARDFTVTAGVGWGRLAGVNTVENPFCAVADTMCTRDEDFGEGGTIAWKRFFRGEDMGFFGGVEWRTPIDKLTLKAEVSSDAYTREQRFSLVRAEVAGQRRRRVPDPSRASRSAATTCTATRSG